MRKKTVTLFLILLQLYSFAQTDTIAAIELFGRVWGMVKFYHPVIQKNKLDWNTVFIEKYGIFRNATNAEDYNRQLKKLLDTLGPIDQSIRPYQYFPGDTTVCNLHFNWVEANPILDAGNKMRLLDLIRFYQPRKNTMLQTENMEGYDMNQVAWENPAIYPDEANCMLAFFNYWNRINYCFAYKKLMDTPWDKTLTEFIPEVRKAAGSRKFYLKMAELTTRLNDGHAWCVNKEVYDEMGSSMNISIEYLEGKTIVSSINDSLTDLLGIHRGDEILETNDMPIGQKRKELSKYIGGSTPAGIDSKINSRILGIKRHVIFSLTIKDTAGIPKTTLYMNDSLFDEKLIRYANLKSHPVPFKFLTDTYGYIDAGAASNCNIKKAFRKFRKTKAIIIDNRTYGGGNRHLYAHYLTNKNNPYALYYQADPTYPGAFKKLVFHSNFLRTAYFRKKYKGKVIVLIDEHTVSGMEFNTMCLQATGKVILIGRNSAGYDGVCRPFLVQRDFGAAYSEDAVFYPDGKQTQRIGIIPDIYVSKTLNSIKQGKDEILERAVHYLNESLK